MKLEIKEKAFYHLQGRNDTIRGLMYEDYIFTREELLAELENDIKNFDFGEGHDFVAVISYNETNIAIVSQRYDTKDSYIIDPKFKDMLEYLAENCMYKVDFNDYLYDINCDFQY